MAWKLAMIIILLFLLMLLITLAGAISAEKHEDDRGLDE